MLDKMPCSRAVIDRPAATCSGAISAETWVAVRPGVMTMLLTGWVTGPLTSGKLDGGMTDVRADMLTETCMPVVIVLVIALVGVTPALCAIIVWACTMLGADVSIAKLVELMADLCSTLLRTLKGVAPDAGILVDVDANSWLILMLVLKFITLPS